MNDIKVETRPVQKKRKCSYAETKPNINLLMWTKKEKI
jgi:hypothetical protein